jgi:hypothetical protein
MSQPGQWQGGPVAAIARRYPGGDGTIVLTVGSSGYDNYLASLHISVLRRHDGVAWHPIDELLPQGQPGTADRLRARPGVAGGPQPPAGAVRGDRRRPPRRAGRLRRAHPELRMSVVPPPAGA